MPIPSEDELATWLGHALIHADGYDSDEWSTNMKASMDYYLGREPKPAEEGSSEFVSMDVADMVEAVLAQMMPSFAGGEGTVTFDAEGESDEDAAQLESDATAKVIMSKNNGVVLLAEAIKGALQMKNAVVKIWCEEIDEVRRESYENLSPLELRQKLQSTEDTTAELLDQAEGEKGINVTLRYRKTGKQVRLKAVPLENFKLEANYDSIFLDNVSFCAERHELTKSDLVEMGLPRDKIAELPAVTRTTTTTNMRNLREQNKDVRQHQDAQTVVEVFECYYRVDIDGDGVTELIRAWLAQGGPSKSDMLLDYEVVEYIPYATGTPLIQPHRFLGHSMYDREAAVQDIKTDALRQYLNNAKNNNVNRATVLEDEVNIDDAVENRASGLIRVRSRGAYEPIPVQDIGPSMLNLLGYMDKIRAERGGAALDMQSGEAQIVGGQVGSQGVDRIYSTKEMMAGLMTTLMAHTLIRGMYLLTHRTLRSQGTGVIRVKRRGQWSETNPASWQPRESVSIKIGLSPAERTRKVATLEKVMQTQLQLLSNGGDGIIVSLDKVHTTLIDWLRASSIEAPEQYWIDPSSDAAQKAKQDKEAAAQAAAQKEDEMRDEMITLQSQLAQAQLDVEQLGNAQKTLLEYFKATLQSETKQAGMPGESSNDLDAMQEKGRAASNS